ncbi:alpha/beta fold hydrolase [Solimicrobium silvestre]|uniref:Alpha/beta hydrolase family n=1 Tax=Solimicrobium silvestre TaxID=2099400 RepID=A0A2S9H2V4_9BURK|nr:alpha/beta hydrolase [Solimicrobium silvestre]PRC94287.1 Alpha/beta hydrolase family [Solimicrobium silvestre]
MYTNNKTSAVSGQPWWAFPTETTTLRTQDFGGYTVAVRGPTLEEYIDGPNVFLVHGMVDSSDTWDALLPALSHCNIWRLDLPWSGRDGVSWPTLQPALKWLQAALALCPIKRGIFVGHSFGATVLLDWLATDPTARQMADGMLLFAPLYCDAQRPVSWPDFDLFARGVQYRFEKNLRIRMGCDVPSDATVCAIATQLSERFLPDAMLELFRIFLSSRHWEFKQLQLPVKLVIGEKENPITRHNINEMINSLPGAECHTLAGCGHYSIHEQPAMLRALLSEFLVRVRMPESSHALRM